MTPELLKSEADNCDAQSGLSPAPCSASWGGVSAINSDCMTVMSKLADNAYDLAICDPPYGINLDTKKWNPCTKPPHDSRVVASRDWNKIHGDDAPFDPAPWLKYKIVVLWGASSYCERLPGGMKWLIWDKREQMDSNNYSDCELAWTNKKGLLRIHRQLWSGLVVRGEENGSSRMHPTQKPVALMAWAMDQVKVPEGATVLDPYMGSGTTGIACLRTNRNFIGIEKDAAHFATACARLERECNQGALL
jgi:site-specific DNA-methyltransferase (adenine-specific)